MSGGLLFGLPKIKGLVGGIFIPLFPLAAMVDQREQCHSLGSQNGLQLIDATLLGVIRVER
jgi:hypothetical protein